MARPDWESARKRDQRRRHQTVPVLMWWNRPPTPLQLEVLRRLDPWSDVPRTRGEASERIDLLAHRHRLA